MKKTLLFLLVAVNLRAGQFDPIPLSLQPFLTKCPVAEKAPEFPDEFVDGICFFEGFRARPYYCCAKVKTIGYGFTDAESLRIGYFTKEQARRRLVQYELAACLKDVREVCGVLPRNKTLALVSFRMNLGRAALIQLCRGRNMREIQESLPLYNRAGGKIRAGLVARRQWEKKMFCQGEISLASR